MNSNRASKLQRVAIHTPCWRLGDGFESTLLINNSVIAPIDIEPLVFDSTGRQIPA